MKFTPSLTSMKRLLAPDLTTALIFLKAFRVYGHVDENNNLAPAAESGEVDNDKEEEEEDDDEEMENADVESVDAGAILDEDNCLEYQLPKHQHCTCHLLNLVPTVDVSKANSSTVYKCLSCSSFAKCTGLWNESARSTIAAEVTEDKCKLQLLRANDTRWNSLFIAERIIRISREQGAIAAVRSALNIPMYVCA